MVESEAGGVIKIQGACRGEGGSVEMKKYE